MKPTKCTLCNKEAIDTFLGFDVCVDHIQASASKLVEAGQKDPNSKYYKGNASTTQQTI